MVDSEPDEDLMVNGVSQSDNESDPMDELPNAIDQVADELDADIVLYNGLIGRPHDTTFIEKCITRRRRTNAVLILVTEGGDADAAYRIARCLQENYSNFILFVSGYCKSAGTLIALGAHELVISDFGELGPLDVQMSKDDELLRTQSGLTVRDTLHALREMADEAFTEFFLHMQAGSEGRITFRSATEIATKMTTGLLAPIYEQVDPMHVGEARRAMSMGRDYGIRLLEKGNNISRAELEYLTSEYPSHGFVIDRVEANSLFNQVREPTASEYFLISALGDSAIKPHRSNRPFIEFLTDEPAPLYLTRKLTIIRRSAMIQNHKTRQRTVSELLTRRSRGQRRQKPIRRLTRITLPDKERDAITNRILEGIRNSTAEVSTK